jgi:RimJ/RimL family protein N-acetyltransferase
VIRTARLILREWRDSDLEPFAALNADPRVREYFPTVADRAESDAGVARMRAHFAEHGFGFWAIEVPDVADFVGMCGLAHAKFEAPFTPCVEIGWRLAHQYWGHGYAPEAARAALDYGFQIVKVPEIVAFTAVGNAKSRRVMEKIGMTYDPADDFDFNHPALPPGHPLRRHVLYRVTDAARRTPSPTRPLQPPR